MLLQRSVLALSRSSQARSRRGGACKVPLQLLGLLKLSFFTLFRIPKAKGIYRHSNSSGQWGIWNIWSFKPDLMDFAVSWFLGRADASGLALLTEVLWFSISSSDSWSEPCSVWQIGRNSPSDFTQISGSSPVLSFCQCILKMYLNPNFVCWQHDEMSFSAVLLNFRGLLTAFSTEKQDRKCSSVTQGWV